MHQASEGMNIQSVSVTEKQDELKLCLMKENVEKEMIKKKVCEIEELLRDNYYKNKTNS